MRVKTFSFFIIAGAILFWFGWLLLLSFVDPNQAGFFGFLAFYLSLFCGLIGLFFLIEWLARRFFSAKQLVYQRVKNSLRQALLFSLLLVGTAILQSHRLLNWWNILLFILVLALLEFFFVSYSGQKKPTTTHLE